VGQRARRTSRGCLKACGNRYHTTSEEGSSRANFYLEVKFCSPRICLGGDTQLHPVVTLVALPTTTLKTPAHAANA
jgi:hypothetical protein